MKGLARVLGALLLALGLAGPAASVGNATARSQLQATSGLFAVRPTSAGPTAHVASGTKAAAANLYRRQAYLVPNQVAYDRAKAAAAARAGQASSASAARGTSEAKLVAPLTAGDPDIDPQWEGLNDASVTPPDTTGAVGPTRYIELVNNRYGIYGRAGNAISTGGLKGFAGANTKSVTDPQIIWDPGTNRFYYVVLEFSHFLGGPNPDNRLYMGFSRTSSPSNTSGTNWCRYIFSYGDFLPDYPKLGDSSAFFMTGVNVFNAGGSPVGSDVTWVSKPPKGTGCPAPAKFHTGVKINLRLHDGHSAFTPVPVNQMDPSATGYVAATPNGGGTFVDTFRVTRNSKGNAVFSAGTAHAVSSFSVPPSAPQSGTAQVLDTLDTRLTNSVSGTDPSKGKLAIWAQHTVATNPAGRSEVRWYEITNPNTTGAPTRSGAASNGSLYVFNGAISPDRKVSGSTKRFGDAFAVGFNTSSSTDLVRIQMVSQWADKPMSGFVEVKASTGFNDDFSCHPARGGPPCRWGDYSGATPDPASNPYSNHGRVWLSNQWDEAGATNLDVDWRTYNWATNLVPFVILTGPSPLLQKVTSFPVSWQLGNQATQANVNVRRAPWNGGFGAYTPWKTGVPQGSDTYAGSPGNTYCFRAEALDSVPQSWGFTADRCAVVPLDDRRLKASAGWSRRTGTGFFLGTYSRAKQSGKSLTRTGIHARSVRVMVEKCPTCGSIKIYWRGSLRHTYSLHASSVRKMVYLSAVSFSSVHTGTLKIVVSSSGKAVIIDALAVSAV